MANKDFQVPDINVPSLSVPSLRVPQLYVPKLNVPGATEGWRRRNKQQRLHVKDFGDLLLGNPITGTKQLRHTLEDAGLDEFVEIPILNRVIGAGLMVQERAIAPLLKGNIAEVGINALETVGSTLDLVANPIKSLMPWAGGGSSTDLLKSFGWIDDEYRQLYQWNTGNFAVDLLGEVISDPTNWITFGSAAAAKQSVKTLDVLSDSVNKVLAKELGEHATSKIASTTIQSITKTVAESASDDASKVVEQLLSALNDSKAILKKELKKFAKGTTEYNDILALIKEYSVSPKQIDSITQSLTDLRLSSKYEVYRNWRSLKAMADKFDNALLNVASVLAPTYGAGRLVISRIAKPTFKAQWARFVHSLEDYKLEPNNVRKFTRMAKEIKTHNGAMYKPVYDTFENVFKEYNINKDALVDLYVKMYLETPLEELTIDSLNRRFTEEVLSMMPKLEQLVHPTSVSRGVGKIVQNTYEAAKATGKLISKEDFLELINAASDAGTLIVAAKEIAENNTVSKLMDDIELFWSKRNPKGEMDAVSKIDYLETQIIKGFDENYDLSNLAEFLAALEKRDKQKYLNYLTLFNYMGITVDNAKEVHFLLEQIRTKGSDKDLVTKLKGILVRGKLGFITQIKELRLDKQAVTRFGKSIIKNKELNVFNDDGLNKKFFKELESARKGKHVKDTRNLELSLDSSVHDFYDVGQTSFDVMYDHKVPLKTNGDIIDVFEKIDSIIDSIPNPKLQQHLKDMSELLKLPFVLRMDGGDLSHLGNNELKEYVQRYDEVRTWLRKKRNRDQLKAALDAVEKSTNKKAVAKVKAAMLDYIDIMSKRKTHDAIAHVKSLLSTAQDLFVFKVVDEGHFNIMNYIMSTLDVDKRLLDELSDVTSSLRKNLKTIVATLAEKEQEQLATSINHVLATLDNTNNLNSLLNYFPVVKLLDDNDYSDYARGLLYNVVFENRDRLSHQMISDASRKELVDRFMTQIKRDKADLFTIPGFEEALRTNVDDAFKTYIQKQVYIAKTNNIPVMFGQHWCFNYISSTTGPTRNAAQILEQLGFTYAPLVDLLLESELDSAVIIDATRFIRGVSKDILHRDIKTVKRKILDLLNKSTVPADVIKQTEKELARTATVSLSEAITEGFKTIDQYNRMLTGKNAKPLGKYWSQHGLAEVHSNLAYMCAHELNNFIRTVGEHLNRYSASTQNGVISFKKVFSKQFMQEHHLTLDQFSSKITDANFARLYQQYEDTYKIIKQLPVYNKLDIETMRNSLIEVYSKIPVDYAPANPMVYFQELDDLDIITWDALTQSKSMNTRVGNEYYDIKNRARGMNAYTYSEKSKYRVDPMSKYLHIKDVIRKHGISTAAEMYDDLIDQLPINANYSPMHELITDELGAYVKDPESLGVYKPDIDNWQRRNVKAYNRLKALDNFIDTGEADETPSIFALLSGASHKGETVGEMLKNTGAAVEVDEFENVTGPVVDLLKKFGITPKTSRYSNKVRMFHSIERNDSLHQSMMSWSAKGLRSFIDHNNRGLGFLIYEPPKYLDPKAKHLGTKFSKKQLSEAGLEMTKVTKNGTDFYVFHRTDNTILEYAHRYKEPYYTFQEDQMIVNKILEDNKGYLNLDDGVDLPMDLYTGGVLKQDAVELILQDEAISKALGEDVGRKAYSIYDENGVNIFWKNKTPRLNTVFVGDIDCYNDLVSAVEPEFAAKSIQPRYNSNVLDRDIWACMTSNIDAANAEQKLIQLIANEDFYIGNQMFHEVFKGLNDKEIKAVFERNNFVACLLKTDKQGRPRIYKIYVESRKQLADAIKAKAFVVPSEMYRTLVLGVNKHKLDSKVLRIYSRSIMGSHKSMFLFSVGSPLRNGLDSAIYKNAASTQGMTALLDNIKYSYKAGKLLEWFNNVQKTMREVTLEEFGIDTINTNSIRKVFATLTPEEQQLYVMLDMFLASGASAGLSKTMEEIILNYNTADVLLDQSVIELWFNKMVFEKSPIALVNKVNDTIEQTSRLALFLNLVEHGLKPDDAIRRVVETHFDYEMSALALRAVEQLFWFSVFPVNNVAYYLNEGMTRNPDMLKLQMDALELSWNDDDYSWEDVRNSDYLSYNALTGNIRFEMFGKQIVLKTGSSVMDFFKLLTDPVGEAKDRVNPYLSVLLGFDDPTQLNPAASLIDRVQQIQEGKSYIPSVYAILNERKKYRPKEYTTYPEVRRAAPKIRKVRARKPDNMKSMRYKFSTNRYYFGRGKNLHRWLSATTSIEPYWYMSKRRYLRTGRNYKMLAKQIKHIR